MPPSCDHAVQDAGLDKVRYGMQDEKAGQNYEDRRDEKREDKISLKTQTKNVSSERATKSDEKGTNGN